MGKLRLFTHTPRLRLYVRTPKWPDLFQATTKMFHSVSSIVPLHFDLESQMAKMAKMPKSIWPLSTPPIHGPVYFN